MKKMNRLDRAFMARCVPIVVDAVERQQHRFDHIPDISKSDLVNKYLIYLTERRHEFDAGKGNLSTWCNMIVMRRIADLAKLHARAKKREHAAAAAKSQLDMTMVEPKLRPDELPAELRNNYLLIAGRVERYIHKHGRPRLYNPAQCLALSWLRRHLQVSARALARTMADWPALNEALDLRRPPSERSLQRIERACVRKFKITD